MRDKLTVKTLWLLEAGVLGLALGGRRRVQLDEQTAATSARLPADVQAITFLQRTPRNDDGNVFDYDNFVAGRPPVDALPAVGGRAADGHLPQHGDLHARSWGQRLATDISNCVTGSDVQSYDLSFDAQVGGHVGAAAG